MNRKRVALLANLCGMIAIVAMICLITLFGRSAEETRLYALDDSYLAKITKLGDEAQTKVWDRDFVLGKNEEIKTAEMQRATYQMQVRQLREARYQKRGCVFFAEIFFLGAALAGWLLLFVTKKPLG